jgi:hypothetical protein
MMIDPPSLRCGSADWTVMKAPATSEQTAAANTSRLVDPSVAST